MNIKGHCAMSIHARAEALAHLFEEHLGLTGQGLEGKLRRAGRSLPRWVRAESRKILAALGQEGAPKLARQIDEARVARAFSMIEKWLVEQSPWEKRRAWAIGFAASNVFNFMVIGGALAAVLLWRGFL
ncbi:MAG: hypothetical protein ACJA06_002135 [Halocynthiibacter sp.]|jgi:hypothetical protein